MGMKRKAVSQAPDQLAQEPRRSRRNADKNEEDFTNGDTVKNETVKKNTKQNMTSDKKISDTKLTKQIFTTKANMKTSKKAINEEKVDSSKEFVPLKTYGKPDSKISNTSNNSVTAVTKTTNMKSSNNVESTDLKTSTRSRRLADKLKSNTATIDVINNSKNEIPKIAGKIIKKKTAQLVKPSQEVKKGNLTMNSSSKKAELKITAPNNLLADQSIVSTVETGDGQKKIIINKIIMAPDAYNQMIKQQQSVSPNQTTSDHQEKSHPIKSGCLNIVFPSIPNATSGQAVPVQHLIKNLPTMLSSGIKIPNLTVTNPQAVKSTVQTTTLPIDQLITGNKNSNLRIVTSAQAPQNPQLISAPPTGGLKQLQLPILIKSIVNPLTNQPTVAGTIPKVTGTLVSSATSSTVTKSITKVNPISSVKVITTPTTVTPSKPTTRTPERVVVNIDTNNNEAKSKKARVSFNFDKNTSTSIKPISNDLPITASNVLLTSTPKQSIIKKRAKVFDIPCTPIVNAGRRGLHRSTAAAAAAAAATAATTTAATTTTTTTSTTSVSSIGTVGRSQNSLQQEQQLQNITQQIKKKIETANKNYSTGRRQEQVKVKYCKQSECDCWSNIPKDDLEKVKLIFNRLTAPKKMMYVYCTTIKINEDANFDFEKYAFYVRTRNGYVQVCGRVYMDIFDKHNLSFVETAFKKCEIDV